VFVFDDAGERDIRGGVVDDEGRLIEAAGGVREELLVKGEGAVLELGEAAVGEVGVDGASVDKDSCVGKQGQSSAKDNN